jgi:peptide-methionine (S)-S-oxide reductase
MLSSHVAVPARIADANAGLPGTRGRQDGAGMMSKLRSLMACMFLGAALFRADPGAAAGFEFAIFAGGCFWCVESDFDRVPGVVETISGYTGGHLDNPTYKDVTSEQSGHREAVRIAFRPEVVSYAELIEIFWRSVDPTDAGGQFCDRGESYTTAIFALDDDQRRVAEASRQKLEASGVLAGPVVTPILDAATFFAAEDGHQNYHEENPIRYNFYRYNCGRDARIEAVWGDEAHRGIPGS